MDFAAFMLGVNHTDLYRCENGGRQIFVFNSPDLVRRFFEDTDCYGASEHHYRNIVDAYAPSASPLLKLKTTSSGQAKPYGAISAALTQTAAGFQERVTPYVAGQRSVEISHEIKRWMLILMAKLLYDFDISQHADEFITRGNFIEEWLANVDHADSWPEKTKIDGALKESEQFFQDIAREISKVKLDRCDDKPKMSEDLIAYTIIRTLINAFHASATSIAWTLMLVADRTVQEALFKEATAPTLSLISAV